MVEKARTSTAPKAASKYRKGSMVVYPAHGLGKVLGTEIREISGHSLELIVIHFEKDRMTLRVPFDKARNSGLRGLSSLELMDEAIETLKGRAQKGRAIWARRAQDFGAKISSGNPIRIAEVVRDLHVNVDAPNRSYSERQIYEAALDRLVRELAAVAGVGEQTANQRVLKAADAPKIVGKPKMDAAKVVDAPTAVAA